LSASEVAYRTPSIEDFEKSVVVSIFLHRAAGSVRVALNNGAATRGSVWGFTPRIAFFGFLDGLTFIVMVSWVVIAYRAFFAGTFPRSGGERNARQLIPFADGGNGYQ